MKINQIFIYLLNLLDSYMRKNLRSACLLFLVFLFFTIIYVGLVSAEEDTNNDIYNYSNLNKLSILGNNTLPTTEYSIWGYTNKNYTFFVNDTVLLNDPSPSKTTMVFYWDCLNNDSYYQYFLLNDPDHIDNASRGWKCAHPWNNTGNYSVAVGIFKLNSSGNWVGKNVSYWIPVQIRNNTKITVQNFSMLDEKEGFEGNNSTHIYNISALANSPENYSYCGYVDNDYSFSVKFNATSLTNEDNRTIGETTTVVYWDYGSIENKENKSDNSILGNISDEKVKSDNNISNVSNGNTTYIYWDKNFTHEWDYPGKKNISAIFFHWDPLDGSEMRSNYSNSTEYKNESILIIHDPKNLNSYPIIGNIQNWGIFLSIIGLIIFYFTYTRNNVPIEISIFGLKPFYLKSVNSLTGTLIFVAGMYLCFVFGRCPWDIPIVSSWDRLSDMYFNMLYHEYVTKPRPNTSYLIPYLSILIGLLDVIILSLIIHMIAIPFYKGEFKIGEFLRKKISSTSAQPEMIPYSVENKTNREN